jgi:hypothetical protein
MGVKFRLDHKGIARLKHQRGVHAYVGAAAHVVADAVPNFSTRRTGRYEAAVDDRMMGFRDARARVYARDFKAHWMEYGAGPSPVRGGRPFRARHPLRNAVRSTGMRFDERHAGNG